MPGNPGDKLRDESEAAREAAAAESRKRNAAAMSALDKNDAIKAAKALREEKIEEKESPFRQFMRRAAEEAKKRKIDHGRVDGKEPWEAFKPSARCPAEEYSPAFEALVAEMVKDEIAKEQAQKKQKQEKEKAEAKKKKAEAQQKHEHHVAFSRASGASEAVGFVTDVATAPVKWLEGFADFLNKNAPPGHEDSFVLLVKLFQLFSTMVEMPLKLVKYGCDSIALSHATPKQREAYQKYMSKSDDKNLKAALENVNKEVKDSTRSELEAANRRTAASMSNESGGDFGTGEGHHGKM